MLYPRPDFIQPFFHHDFFTVLLFLIEFNFIILFILPYSALSTLPLSAVGRGAGGGGVRTGRDGCCWPGLSLNESSFAGFSSKAQN